VVAEGILFGVVLTHWIVEWVLSSYGIAFALFRDWRNATLFAAEAPGARRR